MKPFDIYYWKPPAWDKSHPCVVLSHPDRAERKSPVEVLMCSSERAGRLAKPEEFILDEADGMDWPTLCKCDVIWSAPRTQIKNQKGVVSETRRAPLLRTVIAAHAWGRILAG